MSLKRLHHTGHIYYITTNIYNRLNIFTTPSFVMPLYDSLNFYTRLHEMFLVGYVIMPDHIHLLIWPQGNATTSAFMRDFKKFTASRIIRQAKNEKRHDWVMAFEFAGQKTGRSKHKVWQDSYWDKNLFTERFVRQKLNYIHRNPVRAEIVENPDEYLYSSYQDYITGKSWWVDIQRGWM